VHLFSNVEVVSSLLRCATLLEKIGRPDLFERVKPALHDYLQWLHATVRTGAASSSDNGKRLNFTGWQPEHAHTENREIHMWLTSQVMLYLHSYESLLARDVAAHMLLQGGLVTDRQERSRKKASERREKAKTDDPLQLDDASSPYRVISTIDQRFVQPRLDGDQSEMAYSGLLYGPPGTGKTTLARRIAADLGWPLLTITTSDFIIDGEAQVEARAKKIFEALGGQTQLVVFFDEIDRLLLDRDNPDYSEQGDMLQFMTPSMLTKINNLRRGKNVIFLIGTNYADRIDSAIKRAGRIDQRLLVLPPDLLRRTEILRTALGEPDLESAVSPQDLEMAAKAGYWRTAPDLEAAVSEYHRARGSLVDKILKIVPAVSLSSYKARVQSAHKGKVPTELMEEAFLYAYLLLEGKGTLGDDHEWLSKLWTTRPAGVVRDPQVEQALQEAIAGPTDLGVLFAAV
jgi:hypothetical protein